MDMTDRTSYRASLLWELPSHPPTVDFSAQLRWLLIKIAQFLVINIGHTIGNTGSGDTDLCEEFDSVILIPYY